MKDARLKKGLTLKKFEEKTKIKKSFLQYIETEKWNDLPEYGVVKGFVKSMSDILDIKNDVAFALLRRDYSSNKKVAVNPKPDLKMKFSWSPKITVLVVVVLAIVSVLSYIVYQYINFNQPPKLELVLPVEDQVVENLEVVVSGITDPDAVVIANNQPILVNSDGNFSDTVEVKKGDEELKVSATSRSGKFTEIRRRIKTK